MTSSKRKTIIITLLSLLYSLFVVIGNSFLLKDSFKYIEKHIFLNIIMFIVLFIVFYFILNKLFYFLDKKKTIKLNIKKIKKTKFYHLFDKKTFLFSLIFIIICWLPYIISFYPAILSPDPSFQIKQYFGIPNKYSTYNIMLDPSMTITNHHPVIHTLLLGSCVKIGTIINNVNLGLFIYSIIQIIVLASTLSYTIKFLKDNKIENNYLLLMLLVYSLVPVFPFYSMSAVKDVIFGSLIILYIIFLYRIIKSDDLKIKDYLLLIILTILIILFRNNGIHVLVLSFPALLFMKKKFKYKFKLLCIFLIIIGFNTSYNKIILPHFNITPVSSREMLSIPFQQTARYVKEHGDEVSDKERDVIDTVLGYDTLADRYKPELADPVKNNFNKYSSSDDLKDYFKVWFKELKKHPKTYIEATINNTYGYFYPSKTNWYIYYKYNHTITYDGFDYHYNSLKIPRYILASYGIAFPYIPILNILVNIAINVWILLFMGAYYLYRKKYREIIYLLPCYILILVCFASPANAYFRYALPYVFALMLNLGLFVKEVYEK